MPLQGTLEELPLADLVEMTAMGEKSGFLEVMAPGGDKIGDLAFRDGRLIAARAGTLSGERAFYALLAIAEGSFRYERRTSFDSEDFSLSTASLLMESMLRVDQLPQLREYMPADATVIARANAADDPIEACVLAFVGPGSCPVGDVVTSALISGASDEYDSLRALVRLEKAGAVGIVRRNPQHHADRAGGGSATSI